MTPLVERQSIVAVVDEAVTAGAGVGVACEVAGIASVTYKRWTTPAGAATAGSALPARVVRGDARPFAVRPTPSHALTQAERAAVVAVCNTVEFASVPPSQIVPVLANRGVFLGSESTFYRVLKSVKQDAHRGSKRPPPSSGPSPPRTLRVARTRCGAGIYRS